MPKVLVSAAHTLESPGAIHGDLREADLTRNLLKKVVGHLEAMKLDYKAVPLDLPLLKRIEWINEQGLNEKEDVFIEIHINDGGKRGVEGWFRGSSAESNKSERLSKSISDYICKELKYENQGAKSEYDHELGSLLILNQVNVPGTAIELLYIDNPEDIKILTDESQMDNLAKTLVKSVENFYKELKEKPMKEEDPKAAKDEKKSKFPPLFGGGGGFDSDPFGDDDSDNDIDFGKSPLGGGSTFPSFGGGLKSGSPFGSNPLSTPASSGSSSTALMSRDERKKMIQETYTMVFGSGKEMSKNDENFHLNMATSQPDLIKKLLESKEFKESQEDAKNYKDSKDKTAKMEAELTDVKAKVKDLSQMLHNQNALLKYKNDYIEILKKKLQETNIVKFGEYYNGNEDFQKRYPIKSVDASEAVKPKSLADRISKKIIKLFKI